VIEKKGTHRRLFQRAGQVSSHTHEFFVDDLEMETPYTFRVAALNRFGIGEYSNEAEICTGTYFLYFHQTHIAYPIF